LEKEPVEKAVATRLRRARLQLGMTQQEVAHAVGFKNPQSVVYIESGRQAVKVSELLRFARLFDRSVDSLLGLENDEAAPVVLWRDRGEAAAARAAEAQFIRYCRDYAQIEELAGRRPAPVSLTRRAKPATYEEADRMGEEYSQMMKLGSRPAIGLLSALEEQYGVKLYAARLEGAGSAASAKGSFGAAIMLNCMNAPARRSYDAAHETFHLATWDLFPAERVRCASGERRSRVDTMANRFASALLLPEKALKAELRSRAPVSDWSYVDYVTLAHEFRVSAEAMVWRLVVLEYVSEADARRMLRSPGFCAAKQTEARDTNEDERCTGYSRRFVGLAFECLAKGRISRTRFAELMGTRLCDVDEFLAGWGYGTVEADETQTGTA